MRYEHYHNRITKIAGVLRTVLCRWPFFLAQFALVAATVAAVLIFKGTVISVNCAPAVVYGEELDCRAIALFSKTRLEYRTTAGEWTDVPPVMPGEYELRVVGNGFFGEKTSKSVSFTVERKSISVRSANGTVDYGEAPLLTADLSYDDVLLCTEFETGDIFKPDHESALYVNMMPKKDALIILNADGEDVTAAYDISVDREALRIIPREITVTVEDASKIYDGTALSFDGYELSGGLLASQDTLFAYFTKDITDVGRIENTPTLVLVNEAGVDVTLCYHITVVQGLLTVEKRPLILSTGSGEFDYDATPHSIEGYEISADTPLVDGQSIVLAWGGPIDAGEYQNIPASVTVLKADQTDVTNNYSLFFEAGTLKIKPLPITVSTPHQVLTYQGVEIDLSAFGYTIESNGLLFGHEAYDAKSSIVIDAGTYENDTAITIRDTGTDADVTHNYDITYIRGTVVIQKRHVLITTASSGWVYNGDTYTDDRFSSTQMGYRDQIIVTDKTAVKDAGTYQNRLSVKIVRTGTAPAPGDGSSDADGEYTDVSHNYEISFAYGTLIVKPRPVTLKPIDAEKTYDATPLTSDVLQVTPKSKNPLISGHTVVSAKTYGTLTEVGSLTNYVVRNSVVIQDADGNNVTGNYELAFSVGLLTVKPREIVVQTGSAAKQYDGTPLTSRSFSVLTEGASALAAGHVLHVETVGSLSRVGKTENICSLDQTKIYDAHGKDVTQNYLIRYSYGILEVYENVGGGLDGPFNESGAIGSFREDLLLSNGDHAVALPSILRVKDDRNGYIYLRLKSFGGYAGNEWHEATEYSELLLGELSANYLTSLTLGQNVRKLVINAKSPYVFLPYYASTEAGIDPYVQTSDVIYNGTDLSALDTEYTVFYKDYDYTAVPGALPNEYAEFEMAYRAFVYSQYLILDDETRAYMETIIAKQNFRGNDMETILNVARYIQGSAAYKLDYEEMLDSEENVAIAFLGEYREGNSQHFATALTLLYRAMGIPARYTVGYVTPTVKDEWVEVDRGRVHAWVEVYVDGVGWVEIEATGSADFGLNGSGGSPKKQDITVKPSYRFITGDGALSTSSPLLEYDPVLSELASNGYRWSVNVSSNTDQDGRVILIPSDFVLYDPYGEDVTDQYNVGFENTVIDFCEDGAVVIYVKLSRLQKYYDGKPLSVSASDYTVQGNVSLRGVDISVNISLTEAGYLTLTELNENIDQYLTVTVDPAISEISPSRQILVIFTSYSPPMTSKIQDAPIIEVTPRPVTVVASSMTKHYDGMPLTSDTAYISRGSLCTGHTMTATVVGSITHVGTEINKLVRVVITDEQGNDVTSNYQITRLDGTLTVIE